MKRIIALLIVFAITSGIYAGEEITSVSLPKTLTLDDCLEIALKNSPQVKIAVKKLKDAEGQKISAFSGFIPSVSITGSWVGINESLLFAGLVFRAKDTYSYGYTIQQNLFTSGKVLSGYSIAKTNARAAQEEYSKALSNASYETTKAFYNLLLAQKMAELMEDTYKQTNKHVEQVKAYYDNGMVSKLDLIKTRVQLLSLKPQLTRLKNGVKLAKDAFRMTTGMNPDTDFNLKGEFRFDEVAVKPDEVVTLAMQNKPDIIIMKERVRMARAAYSLSMGGNGPNVVGLYNFTRSKPYNFMDTWGDDWNMIIQVQWPISLSGYGKVKSAKAQLEQAEIGLSQLKDATGLEAKQVVMTLEQEKENILSQKENIVQAQEAMGIAEERYRQGIISNLDYIDTQLTLTQAKTNYYQAIVNYAIAKAQLANITGGK